MKTFFKSILAVAVCASLFVACSKDDTVSDPSNGRKVTMTVTASSELESASGSRTTYDPLTGKISWNETGEYLQVFETAASKTTYANSQEGTVSDGTAKFAVSFPENTNTPLVYNAVYPASAWITSNNTDITNMKVVTRTSQQPTATISTEAYDLIITKDKDKGTYQIASAATPSRILAKNNTANLGFGFYTGSQTKDLTLIPAEYVKLPQITLDPSTLTLSYNDTETHYIPVTLKNAETQDVSVAIYDGTEGTEQPDWITTGDYNGSENRLEVAATENTVATPRTARIVLTATTSLGTANATLLITQNSKPEGGVGETWTYTFESADKDKIAAGLTVNGLTWTASKAPTAFDTNSGIRGLSWSKPSGVTIKTSDYTGGIKKITLVMSANTANLSTVNATVGGQALGEKISLAKMNNQEYVVESETPLSGEIVLTLNTESSGKSLMIKTITIN